MEFYTPKDAAKILKVSSGTILAMIHSGRLNAMLIGGGTIRKTYRIPQDSLREAVTKSNTNGLPEPRKEVELENIQLHPAIAKAMGFGMHARPR